MTRQAIWFVSSRDSGLDFGLGFDLAGFFVMPKVCHGGLVLVRDDLLLCVLEQIFYLAPRETECSRAICIANLA